MDKQIEYGGEFVTIEIKNPCNYNCYYCDAKRQPQELELFDFKQIKKSMIY